MPYNISVIIPTLNEEKSIAHVLDNTIDTFERLGLSGEIVVINDGSTDKTPAIVESYIERNSFIKMIHHNKPKGVGFSYWEAVNEAEGELVTWVPGDSEIDAYEIIRYIPLLEHVDIVTPHVYNKSVRSLKRRTLSNVYRSIMNLSFSFLLNYTNGTAIFRKSILKNINLRSNGFFFQTELLVKCMKKGYLCAEVPYAIRPRIGGNTKAISLNSLISVIYDYLSLLIDCYVLKTKDTSISLDSITAMRRKQFK
ncbi:MAG: dolichyl-phosphate beta-D-mannosyltransferase [Candidatus Scalindua rubra]|uniref:Dolichyl-phosphate beta-D-mannosyltransferase n=1 Tax=Candidatus Scalindua rubra TaxID=1872076 RepID=A0A1E3X5R2_9BACT|nr:MAG: dolichyl-phosphate beta-D-mannosyltransferase [Candidatus Scalindua rubra]